ncbi:type I-U CRISPR-associated RAMP protein Csb1/Cas7u [Mycolicibacter longobardus]|uniref:CRISPR-associated protein n=1 Tax=Mycolicibacter longobardus TaxID=1108812 RepID=A0A1X1YKH9_9MYCO|nr:type I-U CRISPR-associated RAMP protein Csb1/Cas7u [Mycolicibacter longobardus]MCV7383976.1 type I-U CRISPR-associated protein Cas7 [Mycolicibacter longobardus]ORW11572.1 CRISPR-associated protein [Mycolicibacter longobardus]
MDTLDFGLLLAACRPGGAATLSSVTELVAAEGPHGGIAPARFVPARGSGATFCYELRFIDDQPANCVLVDGKASQLNRVEDEIVKAISDGIEPLSLTPRIVVEYADGRSASDLQLPHRLYDAHIRAGHVNGTSVTENSTYRAARDATPLNVRPILELAPAALVLGGWDSTRRARQGRYRSALTGEIIGELADQSAPDVNEIQPPRRGGARSDSIAPSVRLTGAQLEELLVDQEAELSTKTVEGIRSDIDKAKNRRISASKLGLGSIPPSLDGLGLVSCRRIIRSHVLSFAALRQMRFEAGPDGDAACRALLAAFALAGLARANAELNLRANCNLREAGVPKTELDARYGQVMTLAPIDIHTADALLGEAIEQARARAGIRWEGQVFAVTGNEIVVDNADAEAEE